jgi:XTP/dITP diphosphohydrolase
VLRIVLASGNAGKCREFQQVLQPAGIELVLQKSLGIVDAEETGLSFVENAIIKARHAARLSAMPALADDSGLEVDALNGAPGIYSARFSGNDATDERNNQKLLERLRDIPDAQRTARFQCVLVLMRHETDPTPIICQGSWQAPETKNRISHRGQALALLLQTLQQQSHLLQQ